MDIFVASAMTINGVLLMCSIVALYGTIKVSEVNIPYRAKAGQGYLPNK